MALVFFMRVLQDKMPHLVETATIRLFDQIFAKGDTDVFLCEPEKLLSVLGQDLFTVEMLADMQSIASSEQTKKTVQEEAKGLVAQHGMYGLPWMKFEKEDGSTRSFMGSDRFHLIADW